MINAWEHVLLEALAGEQEWVEDDERVQHDGQDGELPEETRPKCAECRKPQHEQRGADDAQHSDAFPNLVDARERVQQRVELPRVFAEHALEALLSPRVEDETEAQHFHAEGDRDGRQQAGKLHKLI